MKKFLMAATALGGVALFASNAMAASEYECRAYAQSEADHYAPNGKGALVGGAFGAGLGAIIAGATGGNAGTGALVGGAGGAVLGGAANQDERQRVYRDAYYRCMNSGPAPQRVYDAPPAYDMGPPPPGYGQQWWMKACSQKYGSFKWGGPHAGQFKGFDGYWHWCNPN